MKVKISYPFAEKRNGEKCLWDWPSCDIVDEYKYSKWYNLYLCFAAEGIEYIEYEYGINDILEAIKKIEAKELEFYETQTECLAIDIYSDRVEFEHLYEDYEKWSCTLDEFRRILLGKKAFLMLPHEEESYLEIKINDL